MHPTSLETFAFVVAFAAMGCSDAPPSDVGSGGSGSGNGGGAVATGGFVASGGAVASAGTGSGGLGSGGATGVGGSATSGGSATGGSATGGSATGGSATGGTGSSACTNVRPTGTDWDEATCDQWATETSECSSAWMIDGNYCNESCGRCSSGASGGTGGSAGSGGSGGTAGSGSLDCSGAALSGGTQYCSSTQGTLGNGVAYSVWLSGSTTGTNCGTFYNSGAAFKASWNMNSGGDFLARAGLQWNKTKTFDQLGTITADYAYKKTGVSNTTAFIGVYGWSSGPLVEFYIVEEWIGWNPASNATKKGTFTVDDGTYDVYTHTQTNQPSIEGTATFPQYFSIRTSARQCGHISITEHFEKWAELGLNLGKMYEAKLLVEAMGGSGTVDFTAAKVAAQ